MKEYTNYPDVYHRLNIDEREGRRYTHTDTTNTHTHKHWVFCVQFVASVKNSAKASNVQVGDMNCKQTHTRTHKYTEKKTAFPSTQKYTKKPNLYFFLFLHSIFLLLLHFFLLYEGTKHSLGKKLNVETKKCSEKNKQNWDATFRWTGDCRHSVRVFCPLLSSFTREPFFCALLQAQTLFKTSYFFFLPFFIPFSSSSSSFFILFSHSHTLSLSFTTTTSNNKNCFVC